MSTFSNTAKAAVRIESGSSSGSGFHFIIPEIIVTNAHVVANATVTHAVTEDGSRMNLTLLDSSPPAANDFAIFRVDGDISSDRYALQPKVAQPFEFGTAIMFAGYPHAIPHLLIQTATIAGLLSDDIFYIDGSVNGGNSGGPIVDQSDGTVIGIVTQRRFLGGRDLEQLKDSAERVRSQSQAMAGQGSVQIMGMDFGAFSGLMADGMLVLQQVLEANANVGIGIGFSIQFVTDKCRELKIQ